MGAFRNLPRPVGTPRLVGGFITGKAAATTEKVPVPFSVKRRLENGLANEKCAVVKVF